MAYLQVRDFPEDLHEQLRQLAKKEHRSVSQQTIVAIKEHIAQAADRAMKHQVASADAPAEKVGDVNYLERRRKVFERVAVLPKIEIPEGFPSVVEIIHEGRAERDQQIMEAIHGMKGAKRYVDTGQ